LAALNYNGGHTAYSLFYIPVENNDNGCGDEIPIAQKGNIEAVDILLCELCNCNLLFGRKIFIRIGDFCQVAPVVSNARKAATILELIKSSPIWSKFEIYNLQQSIQDALDPEYSQLIDDIGDGISDEQVPLTLLNTTYRLEDAVNFIFPADVLNNPIIYLK
ncbi:4218_t:CDS:2, partial [Racocetra persica]